MNDLQQLYDDVFKSLPFSITGHFDFDTKKYEFYEKLISSNFIKYNPNLTLIFSALAQFQTSKSSILQWDLRAYSNFYFKSFTDGDKEKVLSFYFWLLKNYGESFANKEILRPTFILAELVLKDIDFQVRLTNDEYPLINYAKKDGVLIVSIPRSMFKSIPGRKSSSGIKRAFSDLFDNPKYERKTFCKKVNNTRYYEIDVAKLTQENEKYFQLKKEIINADEEEKIIKDLKSQYEYFSKNSGNDLIEKNENLFDQFIRCCLAISFVCYYYSSTIEYMLSVAAVHYKTQNQVYERNLGGLIVGYKDDYNLSSEERTIFNLISDRITSVIAGNYLYNEDKNLRVERDRKVLKSVFSDFATLVDSSYMHSETPLDDTSLKKVEEYIKDNDSFFCRNTFMPFLNSLKEINRGLINKYCLIKLQPNKFNQIENFPFFQKTDLKILWKEIEWDYCNVPFIFQFILDISSNHNDTTAELITCTINKASKENPKSEVVLNINYKPYFDFSGFKNKLENSHNGSFIGRYLLNYYNLLVAHGNIIFFNNNDLVFDAMNDINVIENKIDLTEEFKGRNLAEKYSSLTIKYIHELG